MSPAAPAVTFRRIHFFSGHRVRRLRRAMGATGDDLARAACIERERFYAIEDEEVRPTFSEGMALARALRVRCAALEVRRRVPVSID